MVGNKLQCIRYLSNIKNDSKLYEIKEHRHKRSLSANAYFFVLVGKIADAMSISKTETHNMLISDYGQVDPDVRTIILRDDIDWKRLDTMHLKPTDATRTMDNGKLYRVYYLMRGSHTYNSLEMSILIDGAIQEAQALDIETATVSERDRMIEEWGRQFNRKHKTTEPECQLSMFMNGE